MKCEICGKEIKEEESFKGCCKECSKKIVDRIEEKNNKKSDIIKEINNENLEKDNFKNLQKEDIEFEKNNSNDVANSISIINDVLFAIMIVFAIIIFILAIIFGFNENTLCISLGVISVVEFIVAFIIHTFIKGFIEIINLLDKISKKI